MAARKAKVKSKTAAKPAPKAKRKSSAKPKAAAKPKKPAKASKAAKSIRRKPAEAAASHIEVAVSTAFQLPERFDSAAASDVLDGFKSRRGSALIVDASGVRRVGAQAMQILISATRTWQADGHTLTLENPSAELIDAAALLGLSNSDLSISGSLQ